MLDLKLIEELRTRQATRLAENKQAYDALVRRVADGNGGTAEEAEAILASAGKSVAELVADADLAKEWEVALDRMADDLDAKAARFGRPPMDRDG